MSMNRREELVKVAREFDALVICDDVYDFLQWPAEISRSTSKLDTAVMPRLVDIDRVLDGGAERQGADGFGNVVSNGTFSKIVAPGLRCGWVEGTPKFAHGVSQVGGTWSGGAPSQFNSTYVNALLEKGEIQRHILEVLQPSYGRRYGKMMKAIEEYLFPLGVTVPQSDRKVVGGYFLWLRMPEGTNAADVAGMARDNENLILAQGSMFEVPTTEATGAARDGVRNEDARPITFKDHIRVCLSWEEEENLREGIERLGRVLRRLLDGEKYVPKEGGKFNQTGEAR